MPHGTPLTPPSARMGETRPPIAIAPSAVAQRAPSFANQPQPPSPSSPAGVPYDLGYPAGREGGASINFMSDMFLDTVIADSVGWTRSGHKESTSVEA